MRSRKISPAGLYEIGQRTCELAEPEFILHSGHLPCTKAQLRFRTGRRFKSLRAATSPLTPFDQAYDSRRPASIKLCFNSHIGGFLQCS